MPVTLAASNFLIPNGTFIAELVAFLVSDAAGWITGQTIDSDGGWGIRAGVAPRPAPPDGS